MRKKKLITAVIATGLLLSNAFTSFAGWVAGEYQDEGINWYYYDDNTGGLVTNTWTPDGYYVDGSGMWCPYVKYESESIDDFVNKVVNSLLDYYKQTEKWNFSYKVDYIFSSEEEVTNFNQKLHDVLAVQIKDTYTHVSYEKKDNGYVISSAFVELREY